MKIKRCYSNRRKLKKRVIEHLGGQCAVCGQTVDFWHPESSFECHHIDPKLKRFAIGVSGHKYSWQEVKNELKNCVLVCAICHRLIHYLLNDTGIKPYE